MERSANAIYNPICNEELVSGPCRASIQRYGYDASIGRCIPFIYGGCGGNDNNFASKAECEETCMKTRSVDGIITGKRGYRIVIPGGSFDHRVLTIPGFHHHSVVIPEIGSSSGSVHFPHGLGIDIESSGLITGNSGTMESSAICTLPLESGPCLGYLRRYGFDGNLGKCVPFTYGGCQGNANNFRTLEECQAACLAYTPMPLR